MALVIDLENTVVDYGDTEAQMAVKLRDALEIFHRLPGLKRIVIVTNSRRGALVRAATGAVDTAVISAARKPWTSKERLHLAAGGLPILGVYGDQPLTDGLLAWRLGVSWIKTVRSKNEPWWPRLLRMVGRLFEPIFCIQEEQGR